MAEFLIVSCSLNPESNSRILARAAYDVLLRNQAVEFLDLRQHELPICDGADAYGHPNLPAVSAKVQAARCVLMAMPVYNYYGSASAKNLVELTGKAWTDKIVGFLCAAGGTSSYMSVMSLANSLMLDFRCLIIPRFVYATGGSFDDTGKQDAEIQSRIEGLVKESVRITKALYA